MAADLVTIIETVAVTQFLTPASKNLGEVALKRGKQMASKAVAYLAAVGRSSQSVEEKLLVPMALGAGLESDPILAAHWAALLANAADPAQKAPVQPGFTEVLRQLVPMEARLLEFIYRDTAPVTEGEEISNSAYGEEGNAVRVKLAHAFLGVSTITLQGHIDNLLRLRLCKSVEGTFANTELLHKAFTPTHTVIPTVFGYQFLQAVKPPTS